MTSTPETAPVCGLCAHYEPARNDPHYGYCRPQMQLMREGGFSVGPRLTDVNHGCFMGRSDYRGSSTPLFEAKGGAA